MTHDEIRTFHAERREKLRALYARLRTYGAALQKKGLVVWHPKGKGYTLEAHPGFGFKFKEREAARKLLDLQRNIAEQAMLLLELEHALDEEEKPKPFANTSASFCAGGES